MNATHVIDRERVHEFLTSLFERDLHAKRILSMANVTAGVIRSASLAIHAIGNGLADAEGLMAKHAIKQVDRLLSNAGVDVWGAVRARGVPHLGSASGEGDRGRAGLDGLRQRRPQSTIAIYLLTKHGRATPLVWEDGAQVRVGRGAERSRGRGPRPTAGGAAG